MDAFEEYLQSALGAEAASVALKALETEPSVAVRLNPFKKGPSFEGAEPVPWSPNGLILGNRPSFTLDPFFHGGAYYVQDSSAQFVSYIARQFMQGERLCVLDLCAAPGGKTTDLAASLREAVGDHFLLVANEVMKLRASALAANVARWGDPNVAVTSADPSAFSRLEGFFDMIVADVPCSGEGMFRKDEKARQQWSPDNVALCAARQRRILSDVWDALAPGGVLVYSTCTFNSLENDDNVAWAAETLGARILSPECPFPGIIRTRHGFSLVPGFVKGEGQYCAALRKEGGRPFRAKEKAVPKDNCPLLDIPVSIRRRGETLVAVPLEVASGVEALQPLHPLCSGVALGVMKGKDLVPDADLALSTALKADAFTVAHVDRETALRFLHRDSVSVNAHRGIILVAYEGCPLGFVKNLGTRCNNLLPMSRRILMDV
ncbi:MAG: rRNA cytosine-C5-methyltransferase [Bacteroidales bacterium]|nr:rRNA cytosine-C5-methyltransferase [Bacteroidales bacterium]